MEDKELYDLEIEEVDYDEEKAEHNEKNYGHLIENQHDQEDKALPPVADEEVEI